jgi:hypothetical protein
MQEKLPEAPASRQCSAPHPVFAKTHQYSEAGSEYHHSEPDQAVHCRFGLPSAPEAKRRKESRMSLNQFLLDVGCELQEILWKDVPRLPVAGNLDRIEASLHRASIDLAQLRASVDELCKRLALKERHARWLEARVEVYLYVADRTNAWRHALELDRLRNTLAQERARLQRRQQAYQAQIARVQHLQQQLDDFQSE